MLQDPVRVTIDLREFAESVVRGDGRPVSETDMAALLRDWGWKFDGKGWRGERRAVAWLRKLVPVVQEELRTHG
jgi:hypothetical protein